MVGETNLLPAKISRRELFVRLLMVLLPLVPGGYSVQTFYVGRSVGKSTTPLDKRARDIMLCRHGEPIFRLYGIRWMVRFKYGGPRTILASERIANPLRNPHQPLQVILDKVLV